MDLTVMRARIIQGMRDRVQTTDQFWDRDCRCCMELMRHKAPPISSPDSYHNLFDMYKARSGRMNYHIKGAGHQIIFAAGSEEIHADHSDEEIQLWQDEFYSRGR